MENKIQELTDKIYREGVEKGNAEAQRLVGAAQDEAKKSLLMLRHKPKQFLQKLKKMRLNLQTIPSRS